MSETHPEDNSYLQRLFGVFVEEKTYFNLMYLLLSFGLGTLYFIVLITGLSLGLSLMVVGIGFPILLLTLIIVRGLAGIERSLAAHISKIKISSPAYRENRSYGFWKNLLAYIANPNTWRELFYLLVKFPLGIISLVVALVCVTLPLALMAAPFYYQYIPGSLHMGLYNVDSMGAALGTAVLGVWVGVLSIRFMNGFAQLLSQFTLLMLGVNISYQTFTPPLADYASYRFQEQL